jgi:hypothetical protein
MLQVVYACAKMLSSGKFVISRGWWQIVSAGSRIVSSRYEIVLETEQQRFGTFL